jgi:hypothetical protein
MTDRDLIVTELSSHSGIGALPPDQLEAALECLP